MRPDIVGLGGFDSHALPPRWGIRASRRARSAALAGLGVLLGLWAPCMSSPLGAQVQSANARAGITPPDTGRVPISPKRAFLYSLALPGLGQARLDRPFVGAGFFLMEAFAIAMVHRSSDDLRLARSYRRDSIPLTYKVDQTTGIATLDSKGNPVVATWDLPYYSDALVRARRLQVEDWSAALVFNHLIAGAEAFVAAQLWDLPQHVKLRAAATRGGFELSARIGIR